MEKTFLLSLLTNIKHVSNKWLFMPWDEVIGLSVYDAMTEGLIDRRIEEARKHYIKEDIELFMWMDIKDIKKRAYYFYFRIRPIILKYFKDNEFGVSHEGIRNSCGTWQVFIKSDNNEKIVEMANRIKEVNKDIISEWCVSDGESIVNG